MEKGKKKPKREIDILTKDVNSWWGRTFVLIKKTRIKTWKGVSIVAFISGLTVALILTVSFNIQTRSEAADGATLSLYTDDTAVTLKNGSNLVNMDVLLNTHSNKVVSVRAIVKYDPSFFELQSWDTSNSVFASGNSCIYNGKPCEIINNDTTNGEISITEAKPSPGISTDSGIVAQLVFKALKTTSPTAPNITLSYVAPQDATDSDAILDGENGTDILSGVENATVNIYTAICNSFKYSNWGACQPDGTQSRTVTSSLPAGCYGGTPVLSQDCNYSGTVNCNSVTYSDWETCQPDGTQSRTVISKSPANCSKSDLTLTQNCTYNPSTCTKVAYSDWGTCQMNGTQSRTVVSKLPEGCTIKKAVLERACRYKPTTCSSFTYSNWGSCQPNKKQTRTLASSSPAGCNGGSPVLEQACKYNGGRERCTKFTYSDWGSCQPNKKQFRTVATSFPQNCSGGNPVIEKGCSYVKQKCTKFTYSKWEPCQPNGTRSRVLLASSPAGCSGGKIVVNNVCRYSKHHSPHSSHHEKKDKIKPKFTDLPLLLVKHRGDMVWWKAKDNKRMGYYTYKIFGNPFYRSKKVKTRRKHFFIPVSMPRGVYLLRVKAYDKAGNSKSRLVTLIVR